MSDWIRTSGFNVVWPERGEGRETVAERAGAGGEHVTGWWAKGELEPAAAEPPRVLVLDCGGITNPDCEAGNESVAAAMGAGYWHTAMEVAGVAEAERTPERAAACEAALAPALRRCYAETAAVARRLKEERGMVVGVISNHLVTPGLFGYCAEGARLRLAASRPLCKPDPAIFALFFERLRRLEPGVAPAELLFVDDKPANVEAARSLGWRGLVFSSKTAPAGGFAAECAALGLSY
ncbi:hypothetical protein EMIHUDRAFT_248562 [Emiliania huxleyi CCMP1516]|uniref:Uncharacterized protein n=2 Tax=Emiliania huxleyi TaxID=2903 RepID=A0A0D3IFA1_EMIH1|nr:hypothetical protein EMIHUDRAFT_248562 [Emiliania huxleyi CCMP1516]EOD09936.1 hypothetical protein EMIHUDRAFT_248562 [Emiliania huxleyi CCMP1516]|eukprot:XP_005762365.1 hypothetical protein EMIHUDRAFT_248562 [Emiliania huxleyi CCMP1516]